MFGIDDLLIAGLITGIAGGAGKYASDKSNSKKAKDYDNRNKLFSRWTGYQSEGPIEDPSLTGNVLGGAATGLNLASAAKNLTKAPVPTNKVAAFSGGDNLYSKGIGSAINPQSEVIQNAINGSYGPEVQKNLYAQLLNGGRS